MSFVQEHTNDDGDRMGSRIYVHPRAGFALPDAVLLPTFMCAFMLDSNFLILELLSLPSM